MKRREKRSTWKKDMDVRLKEKMNFFKLEKSKECVFPLGNNHFFSPRALHINMLKKKKKICAINTSCLQCISLELFSLMIPLWSSDKATPSSNIFQLGNTNLSFL